ncbi:MAG: prepilin-type N-terminal cleavage/methylation domain-containing protein [Thermodesulfobacteriota bacterium]|nr:prepilin-type N-terminal cleavage/methylation domain-containing protein [Thermodesulfobacteriota bacterium]
MNRKGFTLVEILIAASVGLIVLGAIYASMNIGQRSSVNVERKVVAQQSARAALGIMAMEIRMASFNPGFAPNSFWRDPGTCNTPPVSQAYKGIQEATANSITVEMDIDGSSVIKDSSNEVIRYNYDTGNLRITRETNCGGAQAFLGNVAGQREVRVVNATAGSGGVSVPLFRYYDRNEIELIPVPGGNLSLADVPDIRKIRITLVVDTEKIDPNLGKSRRAFYSTNVIPRNHAINW